MRSLLLHDPVLQRDFRFQFDDESLTISTSEGRPLVELVRQHQQNLDEASDILREKNRKLFEDLIINDIVRRLCVEPQLD